MGVMTISRLEEDRLADEDLQTLDQSIEIEILSWELRSFDNHCIVNAHEQNGPDCRISKSICTYQLNKYMSGF